MDLDVKTPEATMPEDQPKPAEASININTVNEKKRGFDSSARRSKQCY